MTKAEKLKRSDRLFMIDISKEVQDRRKAAEYFASREGFSASGGNGLLLKSS
jgi:hypothetical protein